MNKKLSAFLGSLSNIFPKLTAKIALYFFSRPIRIARPKSEMAWYESARKFRLKNGIAAFEWGLSNDPLVLLIHGWNGRGTQLASFSESLVENHFRVVALDGPGHGSSSGKKTNPSHFAQFIIDAEKELLESTPFYRSRAVIAHSFGGGAQSLP